MLYFIVVCTLHCLVLSCYLIELSPLFTKGEIRDQRDEFTSEFILIEFCSEQTNLPVWS